MSSLRKTLNRFVKLAGYQIERTDPSARFFRASTDYNEQMTRKIAADLGGAVQGGVFKGLKLIPDTSWSASDLVAKLLGSYEEELHPAIAQVVAQQPDCIVNVGCADGYYAVGLRRLLPDAEVYAFDIDPRAQREVEETQALNGVSVRFRARFDCAEPLTEFMAYAKPFFVFDCEGYEQHIPEMRPELVARSTFLIETHDLFVPGVTARLVEFLHPTHEVSVISEGARNPHLYPALQNLGSLEKYLMLCEFRGPGGNQWIYAKPQGA